VFFNLFFEAEPFAEILIAHGTHWGGIVKFEANEKERGRGSC